MPHITLRADLFGITSLLDYRRQTAGPLCELTQLLLRGPSTLTEAERELIATYVSYRNDCTFCCTAHGAATCQLPGGNRDLPEAVQRDLATAPVSEKVRALLLSVLKDAPGYVIAPAPEINLKNFNDTSIGLTASFWVDTSVLKPEHAADAALILIKNEFEKKGIQSPLPAQTVYLKSEQ